jgi:hypothetical protein
MESIQSILSRHLPRIRNVRDELKHLNYSDNEIIGGVHHFVIQLKDLRNFPTDYIKQHVNALLNEEKGKSLPIGEQKYIKSASNLLNRRAKESKKTTTKKTQSRKTYKQNYDVKINNFSNNHKNNPLLDKNGELLLRAPMQVNPASRIKRPVYLKPNLETAQLDYFYIAKKIKTLKEEKKQIKKELKVEAEPKAKKELKQEIKHIDNIINNTIGNNEPISKINVEVPQAKAKKIQIDKDIQEKFNKDMTLHIRLMLAERRSRNPERIKRYQDAMKEIDERFSKFNEEEIKQLKKNYWAERIRLAEEKPEPQAKVERKKETKPKAKEELKQEAQDINDEEPYIPYHIRSNDSKAKNYVKRIEDLVHQAWLKGSQIEGLQHENFEYDISEYKGFQDYSNNRRRKNTKVLSQFNRINVKENNREIDKLKKEIPGAWELVYEAVNQYQEYINNTVKNPNPDEASLVAVNHFAYLQETFKRPTFTNIVPSKDEPSPETWIITPRKKKISTIL